MILVVSESLRADHLASYGYGRDTSGSLDALAGSSFLFTGAYSQAPCTNPAMANILTSRYQSPMPVPEEHLTMAEYFRDRGYRTAAVVEKNPFLSPARSNLGQGFDFYDHSPWPSPALPATDRAAAWVDEKRGEPFFLWVFYFAPHLPYIPPPELRGRFTGEELISRDTRDLLTRNERGRREWKAVSPEERQFLIDAYDEEVLSVDREVGRLLSFLKERDLYDGAVIVFTADHGEELGEGGLWDHCIQLSREELRVPLLLKMPGQKEGREIGGPVQTIDIFPTLAEIVGGGSGGGAESFQGRTLLPLLEEGPGEEGRYAASFWKDERSIATGGRRYWQRKGEERLLDTGSGKRVDDPSAVAEYRDLLDGIYRRYFIDDRFFDDTLDGIRSLGYFR